MKKDKTEYSPIETAQAILEAVKEVAKAHLAKSEHDAKNLKEMKTSVNKFIDEEGMEKADPMMPKGAPKMGASTGISAPSIPKAPGIPKVPKPMAKFMADRGAKMSKAQPPRDGGPEPIKEHNPHEGSLGKTEHEKGVHQSEYKTTHTGNSKAGSYARTGKNLNEMGRKYAGSSTDAKMGKIANEKSKEEHQRVLGELKAQPKPNLGKSGAFKKLEHKLEGEGHSKESADAISATIGREKYGKAGMAAKAKAGKK